MLTQGDFLGISISFKNIRVVKSFTMISYKSVVSESRFTALKDSYPSPVPVTLERKYEKYGTYLTTHYLPGYKKFHIT